MGPSLAVAVLDSPWGQAMHGQAAQIPAEARLEWFVREMVSVTSRSWAPQTLSEDSVAWYIHSSNCRVCHGIRTPAPPTVPGPTPCTAWWANA